MGAGKSVQVAAMEVEDGGSARVRQAGREKSRKGKGKSRLNYVDVEVKELKLRGGEVRWEQDDRVQPPQHLVLGEDLEERGRFIKMTRRPLMSLISSEACNIPGLPAGLRTDGFYFQPHMPAAEENEAGSSKRERWGGSVGASVTRRAGGFRL